MFLKNLCPYLMKNSAEDISEFSTSHPSGSIFSPNLQMTHLFFLPVYWMLSFILIFYCDLVFLLNHPRNVFFDQSCFDCEPLT